MPYQHSLTSPVVLVLGLVLWLGPTTFISTGGGLAAADSCYAPTALNFTSQQGSLWLNGQSIKLKGVSWFGFETNTNVVHGLWSKTWSFFLDFLSSNKFNIIRVRNNTPILSLVDQSVIIQADAIAIYWSQDLVMICAN
jgi:aryl-phospho-beta-D-glucosidase BglC (GH1 family)